MMTIKNSPFRIFTTILPALILCFAHVSAAQNIPLSQSYDCRTLLHVAPGNIDKIRADFEHHKNLTYEVATNAIENQCRYGGCWTYTAVKDIENEFLRVTGNPLDLSESFTLIQSIRIRAREALLQIGTGLTQGGTYMQAMHLIEKFGTLPADSFTPRVAFEEGKAPNRLLGFINSRVAKYHMDVAQATEASTDSIDEVIRIQLFDQAVADLDAIIEIYSGKIQEKYLINGVMMTPQEYAKKVHTPGKLVFVAPKSSPLLESLRPAPATKSAPTSTAGSNLPPATQSSLMNSPDLQLTGTMTGISKLIIDRLQQGKSLALAIEINDSFIDHATGVMSVGAFSNPIGFVPTPTAYRKTFGQGFGGHLIEIVGVDVDPLTGKIIKIKIQNSWGEKLGDKGFYYIYWDYLAWGDEPLYLKGIFMNLTDAEVSLMLPTPKIKTKIP